MVNRPSASSLTGPAWRPEQWVHLAARLGIPARPVRRRVRWDASPGAPARGAVKSRPEEEDVLSHRVTVVGERWFGTVEPALGERALRLARAAGVQLLAVHFSRRDARGELITADLVPPLEGPAADAVAELLLAGKGASARGAAA